MIWQKKKLCQAESCKEYASEFKNMTAGSVQPTQVLFTLGGLHAVQYSSYKIIIQVIWREM